MFKKNKKNKKEIYHLITDKDINFSFAEAFRVFAVNLRFTFAQKFSRKVIITGFNENMGKTMISTNLAIAMAQSGFRVLLIDCDLRKPCVHKLFKDGNTIGLTHILCDDVKVDDAIKKSQVDNLWYLTAGVKSPNPIKLLLSPEMSELLNNLGREYDWIILDTPPVGVVSDALILSNNCDGVILAAEEGVSDYRQIAKAIEEIKYVNGNLLGVVLNRAKNNRRRYYYQYSYGQDK
jgi:capsular exopolysaccharide synthesis family protein